MTRVPGLLSWIECRDPTTLLEARKASGVCPLLNRTLNIAELALCFCFRPASVNRPAMVTPAGLGHTRLCSFALE